MTHLYELARCYLVDSKTPKYTHDSTISFVLCFQSFENSSIAQRDAARAADFHLAELVEPSGCTCTELEILLSCTDLWWCAGRRAMTSYRWHVIGWTDTGGIRQTCAGAQRTTRCSSMGSRRYWRCIRTCSACADTVILRSAQDHCSQSLFQWI